MVRKSLCGLLSLLVLGGCSHPVAHWYSIDPSSPEDVQRINARAKDRDLEVRFAAGERVSARALTVGPDSTSFLLLGIWRPGREAFGRGGLRIAPTDSIGEIRVFMRKETTLVTTLGLAAVGGLASLFAFHSFFNAVNEGGDGGYDVRFALPGLIGGALYGFFIGEANAEWDVYTPSPGSSIVR